MRLQVEKIISISSKWCSGNTSLPQCCPFVSLGIRTISYFFCLNFIAIVINLVIMVSLSVYLVYYIDIHYVEAVAYCNYTFDKFIFISLVFYSKLIYFVTWMLLISFNFYNIKDYLLDLFMTLFAHSNPPIVYDSR